MGLRILFIEKDVTTADLLTPSMERKGHHVMTARTLRQAMGRIRALRPDLLIIDVASYGIHGYKISDSVRARLDGVGARLQSLNPTAVLARGYAIVRKVDGDEIVTSAGQVVTGDQLRVLLRDGEIKSQVL